MENRKELSEKSKKLIAKQFKSDILNISTGYYKKENIFPITPKPNESKQKVKEFIPKYKKITPTEMHYNNLLSDQQKHNDLIMQNLKTIHNKRNPELESMRKRAKTIKDNCYDERGNFSARKRHFLEFYGIENMNTHIFTNENNNSNIKERRTHHGSFFLQKIPKRLDLNNDNISINYNINKENFLKTEDNKDERKENINNINVNDDIIIKNTNYNKISRNRNNNMYYNLSTISKEDYQNTINCINNKEKMYHRIKLDINCTDVQSNNIKNTKINIKEKNSKKNNEKKIYHLKDLSKVFYTQTNKPVKSNRINKYERDIEEKEYFDIEMKNLEQMKRIPIPDQKKIKEIFYKNGLHIYDFNEDGMNILTTEKKMKAKLRKNKKDENFDRNYRKAQKELKKLNILLNKREILNEKGFESKKQKRKGTPGTQLIKNKEHKDENTKLNTGFGFKRDINILPQNNNNYKNNYHYKMTYFNHNKK